MKNNETFKMTYSSQQQEELQAIRKKYMAPEEDKMAQLRNLDARVTKKATLISITLGIVGTLIMGIGMSFTLSEFGNVLGAFAMPIGIVVGIIGIILLACAYPLYNHTLKKERKKIAPEILRLTEELLK